MNSEIHIRPPVATDLWQQVPAPVQSALLEAWEHAERRCQDLEDRLRELQTRLGRPDAAISATPFGALRDEHVGPAQIDALPSFTPPTLDTSEKGGPVPASHDTRLGHGRRHRHRARRKRPWRKVVAFMRSLFWPAVVLAVAAVSWGLLWWISPGREMHR
jgi:hypothetical protein